jgi:hypothetical protein
VNEENNATVSSTLISGLLSRLLTTWLCTPHVCVDWSNAKNRWANEAPMTCEEALVEAAEETHRRNPDGKAFIYRNLVSQQHQTHTHFVMCFAIGHIDNLC